MDCDENPRLEIARKWARNCEKYFRWQVPTGRGERWNLARFRSANPRFREIWPEMARPAGIEPATPGLEDRASKLLRREDLCGAVRLLVAAFATPSLKHVESRRFGRQPPATDLLQSA